ncbi:Carcinoembryonic antigen-related cell adhesion molecule 3 [Myotis davidii]|uniref:Carcinoembryonic antigen-related cell adhesion molecule 3 n=1 Tax=Myotis davidii TaxID=225400 RepID=L5LI15_MYODS|nr:Carcinoembryonic antigen-related cell adhesion molecule 3 [Myotis davidii]
MESLSVPICRGPVPWQGLLLAVSLLNFWSLPSTAQLAIVSTNAVEGKDVILRIRNKPPNAIGFTWYRGEGASYYHHIATLTTHVKVYKTGYAYSGREKIHSDGCLLIKQVTQKDTGIYTVVVYLPSSIKEIGFGRLNVYVSLLNFWSLPTTAQLSIVSSNAEEGQDVTLRIRNMPPDYIGLVWYRGEGANYRHSIASLEFHIRTYRTGRAYSGREQINFDGSLHIKRVTLKDTGIYTVVVYLRGSKKEIGFGRLNVYEPLRWPTLPGSNTTVTEHKDSLVLTCYTNAVYIQWFFNGMNLRLTERMKLSWNDRTLTIDPMRREDAGNYQCEVSNPMSSADSEAVELDVKY